MVKAMALEPISSPYFPHTVKVGNYEFSLFSYVSNAFEATYGVMKGETFIGYMDVIYFCEVEERYGKKVYVPHKVYFGLTEIREEVPIESFEIAFKQDAGFGY